jgi:hypothetical protein
MNHFCLSKMPWLRRSFGQRVVLPAALLCLAMLSQSGHAQTKPAAPAIIGGSTNSPLVEPPNPQSVFVMPAGPPEGKDPFFPHSTHPYISGHAAPTNQVAAPITAELHLNGISGPPDHRLAIINYKTFDAGQEQEVNTNAGKIRVRCIEIQPDAVIIQIGTERRILHLRPGA